MSSDRSPEPGPQTHLDPSSWEETVTGLLQLPKEPRIFRGQRKYSWNVRTRLARDIGSLPPNADSVAFENSAIGFFMDRATGLLPTVPDEHDLLGWLSLMQHYGAPTRLLDWSESPFVASYFAYEQASGSDAAVYALNPYYCRRQFVGTLFPGPWDHTGTVAYPTTDAQGVTTRTYPARGAYRRDQENELLRRSITDQARWPLPTIPFAQDERMAAQQTIFTAAGDLNAVIDDLFDKNTWPPDMETRPGVRVSGIDSLIWPLDNPSQLLIKIRLRAEWRSTALRSLGKMGITAASLFPGLDGLGRATSAHAADARFSLRDVLTGVQWK